MGAQPCVRNSSLGWGHDGIYEKWSPKSGERESLSEIEHEN